MNLDGSLPRVVGGNVAQAITAADQRPRQVATATAIPHTTFQRHLTGAGSGFNIAQLEAIGHHLNVDPIIFFKVIV